MFGFSSIHHLKGSWENVLVKGFGMAQLVTLYIFDQLQMLSHVILKHFVSLGL